ncbi:DUF4174 domain-containing protein [Vibrio alginolyticus]|uniref:DUF4174 domain-containing protein n=1 Tax=Vibrio alginolyticus TaxID=663 RepID=UPI001BD3E56D|nr:DUF4174 domain-containing protein [Vibrio alginolyticus]EGQ9769104.1 DUF4174 domain-containing protein [Vibrio alginolyticus]EHA1074764.1 DUF4174 domain-containing protein [Vibrio alginolyticus]EHA1133173.1 DUF4174 domain-containing protein [Vibrio alginolyticus]ELA6590333.1 DUF4174 domain-containing protein [Vibrio alginolyticus]MBS9839962.1 DUF4174 domain-containing protein [Vibrio alginolyticus]
MGGKLLVILLSCILSSTAFGYPAHSKYWPHRSVLYFAPENDEYVKQFLLETLMNECELEDRDVVTLVITEQGYTFPAWLNEEFDLKMLARLYAVEKGSHTAILLGKDGLEKHRRGAETDWPFINNLIDQMPMRKQEMQRQQSPCKI